LWSCAARSRVPGGVTAATMHDEPLHVDASALIRDRGTPYVRRTTARCPPGSDRTPRTSEDSAIAAPAGTTTTTRTAPIDVRIAIAFRLNLLMLLRSSPVVCLRRGRAPRMVDPYVLLGPPRRCQHDLAGTLTQPPPARRPWTLAGFRAGYRADERQKTKGGGKTCSKYS
jgi:hypothetical protein